MKFRTFFIAIIIALCLCLFGCGVQPPNDPTTFSAAPSTTTLKEPSWQEIIAASETSHEDESGNIYFTHDGGIWFYDADMQSSFCIVEEIYDPWQSFCIQDNNIYYRAPKINAVARMDLDNPSESEVIISEEQLKSVLSFEEGIWISEIVNGDILVFQETGLLCYYAYNLKTSELFRLQNDVGSWAVWNNMFYFVEHATRTFSLYRRSLYQPDAQPELVLGSGKYYMQLTPEESFTTVLVNSVYVEDNRLFFNQSGELWEFKEDGNHVRVEP